jgi:hypothetical protein
MLSAELRAMKEFFDRARSGKDGRANFTKLGGKIFSANLADAIEQAEALEATALVNIRALLEADLPDASPSDRELLARAVAELDRSPHEAQRNAGAQSPDFAPLIRATNNGSNVTVFPLERRIGPRRRPHGDGRPA